MHTKTCAIVLTCPLLLLAQSTDKDRADFIKRATAESKSYKYHVIFREVIDSKEQSKWVGRYKAKVEIYVDGKLKKTFRGSTLPNHLPGKNKPKGWKYSVVQANGAFPADLRKRQYKWKRGKRADKKRDCLRLAERVPTVGVGSERANEMKTEELLNYIIKSNGDKKYAYAKNILVHSGFKTTWRGSAGCLTIHPDDAKAFFALIPLGVEGTLEVARGIHDKKKGMSYHY